MSKNIGQSKTDELVQTLRDIADSYERMCVDRLQRGTIRAAADLIESLTAELAASQAKYAELQRYNVACTKQCDKLLIEKAGLKEHLAAADAIYQLESLRDHCRSMIDDNEPDCIWGHDVAALEAGIAALKVAPYTTYGGKQKPIGEQGKADDYSSVCEHERPQEAAE